MTNRRPGGIPKFHKDIRPLVRAAVDAGWELSYRGKHPKLTAPDGYATPVPSNGNHHGLRRHFILELRKHGVNV